ncbi:MAG: hypothetical protein Q8M65_11480, partial [Rhodoglobus sp.]|nr:hypothetical protein [Rhodoglobus sp.]
MRVQPAQPIPRTPILVLASIVVLVAAALVPVPGVFPAAAAGVLICAVALTKSVWDAVIATVVGAALILIAAGTGANVMLAVAFMATVSLGAAAAMRIGRGTIALVVAAVLSIVVAASAGTEVSLSALSTSGVALASGLLLCSVSAFVVRLSPGPAPRAPRAAVVAYVALLVPIAAVATWANTTVF